MIIIGGERKTTFRTQGAPQMPQEIRAYLPINPTENTGMQCQGCHSFPHKIRVKPPAICGDPTENTGDEFATFTRRSGRDVFIQAYRKYGNQEESFPQKIRA